MLSDEQIDQLSTIHTTSVVCPTRYILRSSAFARAIESAACAERDARIAELERFAQIIRNQALEDAARCCDVTPPQPFRPSIEAAHAIRSMKDQ